MADSASPLSPADEPEAHTRLSIVSPAVAPVTISFENLSYTVEIKRSIPITERLTSLNWCCDETPADKSPSRWHHGHGKAGDNDGTHGTKWWERHVIDCLLSCQIFCVDPACPLSLPLSLSLSLQPLQAAPQPAVRNVGVDGLMP
eukprot:Opistho-2@5737